MLFTQTVWDERYKTKATPWDANSPDPYVVEFISSSMVKPTKTLDIGCGNGNESIFLSKNGFDVTGIDLSKEAIKQAKQKLKLSGENVKFINGNFLDFGENQKFGFILDRRVFHFFDHTERPAYAEKVLKLLDTNGKFLLLASSHLETGDNRYHFTDKELKSIFYQFQPIVMELIEIETHKERPKTWACVFKKK